MSDVTVTWDHVRKVAMRHKYCYNNINVLYLYFIHTKVVQHISQFINLVSATGNNTGAAKCRVLQ